MFIEQAKYVTRPEMHISKYKLKNDAIKNAYSVITQNKSSDKNANHSFSKRISETQNVTVKIADLLNSQKCRLPKFLN